MHGELLVPPLTNPKKHHWSLRLADFDYSQDGAYFVTIVLQNRKCLFGSVIDGEMVQNEAGKMVDKVCKEMPKFLQGVEIFPYQIMPNHFHAIIVITNEIIVGADLRVRPLNFI